MIRKLKYLDIVLLLVVSGLTVWFNLANPNIGQAILTSIPSIFILIGSALCIGGVFLLLKLNRVSEPFSRKLIYFSGLSLINLGLGMTVSFYLLLIELKTLGCLVLGLSLGAEIVFLYDFTKNQQTPDDV